MPNMLEAMAAGIDGEKKEKGRGLTPLVSERLQTPAAFPNDLPEDAIRGIITDLVRQHTALGEVIDALSLLIGADPKPGPVALVDQIKQKEREADARVAAAAKAAVADAQADGLGAVIEAAQAIVNAEAADVAQEEFAARLAAQTAAAQAATFEPEPAEALAPSGWACPNGHDTIEERVSPRGRQFARCSTCGEFQK